MNTAWQVEAHTSGHFEDRIILHNAGTLNDGTVSIMDGNDPNNVNINISFTAKGGRNRTNMSILKPIGAKGTGRIITILMQAYGEQTERKTL